VSTTQAQLNSLTNRLENIQSELADAAQDLDLDGRDDIGRDIHELERSVAVAARRLRRIVRTL